jgi:hypothetical protein
MAQFDSRRGSKPAEENPANLSGVVNFSAFNSKSINIGRCEEKSSQKKSCWGTMIGLRVMRTKMCLSRTHPGRYAATSLERKTIRALQDGRPG